MPFVHVRSLPLDDPFDADAAVRVVSTEFASEIGTEERHVTVTWQTLDAQSAAGGRPILVDVVAPDFNDDERIVAMLRAAAGAVARAVGVEAGGVFAEFRGARSGQVLDGGEIVRW